MKDFKELYEQAIEETFSGELHKILYENELASGSLTTDHVETLRNLFHRYTNLRNLGNAELNEYETGIKPVAVTRILKVSDETAVLPYKCSSCFAQLWELTRYCPHCGRLNINFEEEN